jgi:poly(A) polymerase
MSDSATDSITVSDSAQRNTLDRVAAICFSLSIPSAIVGGFIRDARLGQPSTDLDLAVFGNADELASRLAVELQGKAFPLHTESGMYRITLLPETGFRQLDLSAAVGELSQDLGRRDFTANAVGAPLSGYDPATGRLALTDPLGGLDDIDRKILRAVSAGVFRRDPARLLRAARLSAELGFTIAADTETAIRTEAGLVATVAGERTREELLSLLSLADSGQNIERLDHLGLLTTVFPELEACRGVVQPKEHSWDVFNHSLKTIAALDWILGYGPWPHATENERRLIPLPDEVRLYFNNVPAHGGSRLALSRLAALLHDISKPDTRVLTDSGRIRFFGHAQQGAELTRRILERLRFSRREIDFTAAMVKAHLRPVQMGPEAIMPTPRAVARYRRDTGDAALATLYLSMADHLAARGPALELDNFRQHVTIVAYIREELDRQTAPERHRPLVDGFELQRRFGLKPGPKLGRVMAELREAQAAGEITNHKDAVEMAGNIIGRTTEDR